MKTVVINANTIFKKAKTKFAVSFLFDLENFNREH